MKKSTKRYELILSKSPDDLEIRKFIETLNESNLPVSTWLKSAAVTGIRAMIRSGKIKKINQSLSDTKKADS